MNDIKVTIAFLIIQAFPAFIGYVVGINRPSIIGIIIALIFVFLVSLFGLRAINHYSYLK